MYGHVFSPGGPGKRGDVTGIVCTVCGELDSVHNDEPIPAFAGVKGWVAGQLKSDLNGKNRTLRDWFSAKKLLWRIRRKKQLWGRQ